MTCLLDGFKFDDSELQKLLTLNYMCAYGNARPRFNMFSLGAVAVDKGMESLAVEFMATTLPSLVTIGGRATCTLPGTDYRRVQFTNMRIDQFQVITIEGFLMK